MSERTEESDTPPGVSAGSVRRTANHWLLSAAPTPDQTRYGWPDSGAAWLRPGALFAAVIVRAGVMHEAVGEPGPERSVAALTDALDGPVFYRRGEFGPEAAYTVLLPASAARIWQVPDTVVLPPRALLLVPAPDRSTPNSEDPPWWVVPPDSSGSLCTPALLASLLSRRTAPVDEGAAHA